LIENILVHTTNLFNIKVVQQEQRYYYICPRYWSLNKNVSLTEEEVASGDYGNIIPQNAKKSACGW
jgi:hypothetical protein